MEEEGKEEAVKIKEQAILLLGKILAKHGFAEGLFEAIIIFIEQK